MEAVLHSKELIPALSDKSVERIVNERALAVVVILPDKNLFRAVQEIESINVVLNKLQARYAGKPW